jgi:single-stranded DNA-binding protein
MNQVIIFDARVVAKARVNKVGDRTLVNVRVADNPIGQKNKDRYQSRFVECTFSGFDADRAAALDKGDVITVMGEMFNREYTMQDKGAKPKKGKKAAGGEKRMSFEIPYCSLKQSPFKEKAEAEEEVEEGPELEDGDDPFDEATDGDDADQE